MGITAASMATMRPLMRRIRNKGTSPGRTFTGNMQWFGSVDKRSGSSSQNQSQYAAKRGLKRFSHIKSGDSDRITSVQEYELHHVPSIEDAVNGLRQHPLNTSKALNLRGSGYMVLSTGGASKLGPRFR